MTDDARQLGATMLRKRADSALRLEQERFRHAFEHSSIGLALVAPDGHWLRVNTALCEIVGYSEQELLASSFQDITHPEDLAADVAYVQLLLGGAGDSYRMEKRYLHQAGHIVWAMLTASLVRDADGRALFFVAQIQDITASKRYEQAILEARDAAQESNRAKSAFLASMSHELRTPLNAVIGFSRVLKRNRSGNLQPDEMKLLERIELNGQHLLALISDILDLSKIEAGHIDIQLRPVGIASLVTEVLAQVDVTATSKGLRVETVLPPNVEAVMLDPMRFKQVLLNLVGNAVKFSERGVITVALHVENGGTRPTHLTVSDTGIGIPADRLQAVFEPFEQAEVGTARKYGGTGLGLPISRTLCEAMGLRLAATSTAGAGSTFTIWFDVAQLDAAA
jgi:PAS domain S-box-containing protein